MGVARAWVQANKIEQGWVEEGGGLLFFPPGREIEGREEERSWELRKSFRWRDVFFFILYAPSRTPTVINLSFCVGTSLAAVPKTFATR